MITHLRAKNFKSWADTGDLRIAPLTGFFGTNSSGKTSLLQLLLMMKQTAESNDKRQVLQLGDAKSLVDLGTFDDLIHNHDVGNSLDISLSYRLSGSILNDWIPLFDLRIDNLRHIRDFVFNVALSESQNHVNVNEFAYKIGNYSFGMKQTLDDPDKYEVVIPNYSIRVGNEDRRVIISQPSKFFGFPDEVTNYKDASFFL